jgi:hypothetical protein
LTSTINHTTPHAQVPGKKARFVQVVVRTLIDDATFDLWDSDHRTLIELLECLEETPDGGLMNSVYFAIVDALDPVVLGWRADRLTILCRVKWSVLQAYRHDKLLDPAICR